MADTDFSSGTTIASTWLNDVNKLTYREQVSVTRYGTVGDGVTDDQAAIQAAVTAANTDGFVLYWPAGTYVSSTSIDNFHDVTHAGPGTILRGSDTFYITPKGSETNNIYTSTAGSALSDGLSSAQPRQTLQAAINVLENWIPQLLDGVWKIKMAAGTYARAAFPTQSNTSGLISKAPIYIEGPDVGGHPNVPTAIVKEGATEAATGINCAFTDVYIKNVKVEDYNGSVSSSGIGGGNGHALLLENVHVVDCYYGVSVSQGGSRLNIKGGIFSNCGLLNGTTLTGAGGAGVRMLFQVKSEIGNQNATDLTQGPIFQNNVTGILGQEGITGHADWVTFQDNTSQGVRLSVISRLNLGGCAFYRNSIAIQAIEGSYADAASNTVFGTGADANGRKSVVGINSNGQGATTLLDSGASAVNHMLGSTEYRFKASYPNTVVTSTSSGNTIEQFTIVGNTINGPAYSQYPAAKIRCRVTGTFTGTNGSKNISIRLANAGVTAVATFGSSAVGGFIVELDAQFIETATQLLVARGSCNAQSAACGVTQATVDMSVDQPIFAHAYVGNALDSITIRSIEWFIAGV